MQLSNPMANNDDLNNSSVSTDVESSAQCNVTFTPGTGGFTLIPEIIAGYTGGGSGTLTVNGIVGGQTESFTYTVQAGSFGQLQFQPFDGQTSVTVTLASVAGKTGYLIVSYVAK